MPISLADLEVEMLKIFVGSFYLIRKI